MKKVWIFIGRMQPVHLWHIKIIETLLYENDISIVFLWSINIIDCKNPYTYKNREKMIQSLFLDKNLIIDWIEDVDDDKLWVNILFEKIYKITNSKQIQLTFYCWDIKNDFAIKVIKEYSINKIKIIEISRKNSCINYNWKKILLSSTNLRRAILEWDKELINMMTKK